MSRNRLLLLRRVVTLITLMLVVAGCSTEPTTADEHQALQQEPAIADQQIAETERDLVRAEGETEAVTVIDTPPIKAT